MAPLTPFTGDLKIADAALKREIDYVIGDCGLTAAMKAAMRLIGLPVGDL